MKKEDLIKGIQECDLNGGLIGNCPYKEIIELLKEHSDIVRCKNCIHRGNSNKCVLAAISEEKHFPLFMLDNRGEWFCGDGERKTSNENI